MAIVPDPAAPSRFRILATIELPELTKTYMMGSLLPSVRELVKQATKLREYNLAAKQDPTMRPRQEMSDFTEDDDEDMDPGVRRAVKKKSRKTDKSPQPKKRSRLRKLLGEIERRRKKSQRSTFQVGGVTAAMRNNRNHFRFTVQS